MKKELTKSAILGGLVLGTLIFGAFKANAADLNQNAVRNGKEISPIKLQDVLETTAKSSN